MDDPEYNALVQRAAEGQLAIDDPLLAAEVDDIRDWCSRVALRQNPTDLIHNLLGPELAAWHNLKH